MVNTACAVKNHQYRQKSASHSAWLMLCHFVIIEESCVTESISDDKFATRSTIIVLTVHTQKMVSCTRNDCIIIGCTEFKCGIRS